MQTLRWMRHEVASANTLQRVYRAHCSRVEARHRIRVIARERQLAAVVRLQTAMRAKWHSLHVGGCVLHP